LSLFKEKDLSQLSKNSFFYRQSYKEKKKSFRLKIRKVRFKQKLGHIKKYIYKEKKEKI